MPIGSRVIYTGTPRVASQTKQNKTKQNIVTKAPLVGPNPVCMRAYNLRTTPHANLTCPVVLLPRNFGTARQTIEETGSELTAT